MENVETSVADGAPPMPDEERSLRTRFAVTSIAVGVLMMTQGIWSLWSHHNREINNAVVAQVRADIDTRITETKAVIAEAEQLNQKTADLNARAAKIEETLRGKKSLPK